ncbi:MAG: TonB-dependent receptor domain-containing protein [Kiloniellales bacterium]
MRGTGDESAKIRTTLGSAVAAVALAVALAAAPPGARAQVAPDAPAEADTEARPTPSLAEVPVRSIDKISITATRNPIEAFEYPGMVTVVDQAEIRNRQASTPDDILQLVPNVEFSGGPRRTGEVPSIRGFSGPDVIVLIDGARQNFGSAHDGRFFVDPSLLKSVEVLRGPSSALYGSGGTGGVIEFRTLDAADLLSAEETFGVTVSGGYQTSNREAVEIVTAYGTPIAGLDLIGSVTKRDSGSIRLGNGGELTAADDDILAGLAKATYELAEHQSVEAAWTRFDNTAEEPSNGQGLGSADIVEKDILADTWRLAYNYHDPADKLIDLDLSAHYTRFRADELRLDSNGSGPPGEILRRDVDTVGFRLDNRSRAMLTGEIGATFTYGGEVYRDQQDGAQGADERDGVPDAKATFYGVFAQAEIAVAEPLGAPGDLLVVPGLRFDDYSASSSIADDNQDRQISPRIGVSYLPTEWLMVFSSYSHAFRAPTFDELYLTGVHFQIPVGAGVTNRFVNNPDLKPQSTRTVEAGAGLTFDGLLEDGDSFQVKGSHFVVWGEDFIDVAVSQPELFVDCDPFVPGDCDGTTTNANVPKAKLHGSEVEFSYAAARFALTLGYSTIDGENEDTEAKLGALAPDQLTADLGIKLPEIDSLVGWRVLAADRFDKVNDPAEARDGYTVHDLYFSWAPREGLLRGLRLDLGIDNLFDRSYARVFTNAPEPGRGYNAFVSYSLSW